MLDDAKEIKEMSFEEALKELEQIVKEVESGQTNLQNMIDSFERGALLKKHCDKKIEEAKLRIRKVVQCSDGSVEAVDIECE